MSRELKNVDKEVSGARRAGPDRKSKVSLGVDGFLALVANVVQMYSQET